MPEKNQKKIEIDNYLLRKILAQMILDHLGFYLSQSNGLAMERREAERWFFGNEEWGIKFEDCCRVLNINPGKIRQKILAMKKAGRLIGGENGRAD